MACVCHSENNKIFLLNNKTNSLLNACRYIGGFPAARLEKQDYEHLERCLPPEPNTEYSIRLIFHRNRTMHGCNNTYPFYWVFGNDTRTCVDGKPLNLPVEFTFNNNCNVATVRPGSSNNIFNNVSWTPCAKEQHFICQLEAKNERKKLPRCNIILTTARNTKATTRTPASTNCTPRVKETPLTISTATIVGSVVGICVILLILVLFYLLYKRNQAKKSTPKNQTQEDVSKSVLVMIFSKVINSNFLRYCICSRVRWSLS